MAQFNASNIKKIGVFTSGGDSPGMNAGIRAVVRTTLNRGLGAVGIMHGYQGILNRQFKEMTPREMANIIQRGGTVLKTARCLDFLNPEPRRKAVENLKEAGIDALVCIGGDGSYRGAHLLWQEHQFPVVGIPGTIDNDIFGTDVTIGYDTAVNTALEAIDKIRDTASSHDRLFIVEVMGRESGFIALDVGVAGGAEEIFIPENTQPIDVAIQKIKEGQQKGKASSILVTAEGQKPGRAYDLADMLRKKAGLDAKVCILGHIQRGGNPTAMDRVLASRLGYSSVDVLLKGYCDIALGVQGENVVFTPFTDATTRKKTVNLELLQLARVLST